MHSTEQLDTALAGRYRIERALGQGGMATVYLAQDLKHERKVAIKVLKPELAAVLGADRFVVEIKTTASLQHPHILPLFDSGEAGGFLYYVMPYIQGETIREKLNRETQFSVDEAIRIAREVADALDYAHRHGVIHRDIKPENILLHDGRAMVMDFGIALAVSAAAGGRMTETGLSLGTPHYMSPEQATAEKEITPRSDIYSLASVLYEMLSGQPPHIGGAAQQVIMKIITEQARPVNQLRRNVPPNVTSALAKALEKLPADRFENAKAFRDALESGSFSYATTAGVAADGVGSSRHSLWRGPRAALAAWAVAVVALGVAVTGWLARPTEPPARRLDLSLGSVTPALALPDVVISPDGTMLAMGGSTASDAEGGIYVRHLDGDAEFRKIPGTEGGIEPAFSPDNQWIAFRRAAERALVKVNVNGGGAVTLVSTGTFDPHFPHWGDDGRIVFSGPSGNGIVSAEGGEAKSLPKVTGRRPFLLPDGSGVVYSDGYNVRVYVFKTDSAVTLLAGRQPVYVPTGHLLYAAANGGLFAVAFDLKRHRVTGGPVRILERVAAGLNSRGFSVSRTGTLVQHDAEGGGGGTSYNDLVIVDPGRGADTVRLPRGRHLLPRFSRDGKRIAMEVAAERANGETDIYAIDLVSGAFTQLTFEGDNDEPAWSPDGKLIAYDKVVSPDSADIARNTGEGLFIKPADNSGPERRVTTMTSPEIGLQQWIDARTLLFDAVVRGRGDDIFTVSIDSGSRPAAYLSTPFIENEPHLSPDGKLLVYISNETGAGQLWMRDYPTPVGKWNLARGGPRAPRWTPDGKAVLFWRAGPMVDSLLRVRIDRTPGIVVHEPELVATLKADGITNWDLHPDGRRFVVAIAAKVSPATNATKATVADRYLIIDHWFSDLRRVMGRAK